MAFSFGGDECHENKQGDRSAGLLEYSIPGITAVDVITSTLVHFTVAVAAGAIAALFARFRLVDIQRATVHLFAV